MLKLIVSRKRVLVLSVVLISLLFLTQANPVLATAGVWSASGSNIYYNDGSVGLGTSSPAAKLDIYNSASSAALLRLYGGAYSTLFFGTGTGNAGMITTDSSTIFRFDTDNNEANSYMAFQRATGSFVMTITGGNKVGILTTSPQYELSVNGTVQAKQVIVNTGWSDYVFDKNYQLKPLNEVEAYINKNKHLPDVPSADEVAKNGVNLGQSQADLLRKIEELTLYTIQQDKKLSELEARLAKLENR